LEEGPKAAPGGAGKASFGEQPPMPMALYRLLV
jgi:hypothetical protein